MKRQILTLLAVISLSACGDAPVQEAPPPEAPLAQCKPGQLEPDLTFFRPMAGPAVQADGSLAPGRYIVSSTYLALKPGPQAMQRFQELMGPISEQLQRQPGLMALHLASSESCGTARTLALWKDEESMYAFVSSDAHLNGIASVGEVSRGGSVVTHWADDERGGAWDKAALQLGALDGPFY